MGEVYYDEEKGDIIMKGRQCNIWLYRDCESGTYNAYNVGENYEFLPEDVIGGSLVGKYEFIHRYRVPAESLRNFLTLVVNSNNKSKEAVINSLEDFLKKLSK